MNFKQGRKIPQYKKVHIKTVYDKHIKNTNGQLIPTKTYCYYTNSRWEYLVDEIFIQIKVNKKLKLSVKFKYWTLCWNSVPESRFQRKHNIILILNNRLMGKSHIQTSPPKQWERLVLGHFEITEYYIYILIKPASVINNQSHT